MLAGCLRLLAGMAVTFGAIAATAAAAFLAGTAVAGAGFGLAFLGSFRMITALAEPDDRAGLVAAVYIVGYLAFSVPALIAGVATTRFGLHATALVYAASLAALATAAVGLLLLRPDAGPAPGISGRTCRHVAGPGHDPAVPAGHEPPGDGDPAATGGPAGQEAGPAAFACSSAICLRAAAMSSSLVFA